MMEDLQALLSNARAITAAKLFVHMMEVNGTNLFPGAVKLLLHGLNGWGPHIPPLSIERKGHGLSDIKKRAACFTSVK